jgi:hypothetical protein
MKSIANIIKEEVNQFLKTPQEIANSLTTDPRFKKGTVLVNIDVQLADEAFKRDEGFYIGKEDRGIANRKEKVMELVKSGELKYAPEASIRLTNDGKPLLSFGDGRHRFAVLRDLGVKTINMSIWSAPQSKKLIPLLQRNSSNLNEETYKVYHGTNNEFDRFDFNRATQGIVWFTDSIDSIKNQTHGGAGNKYIMTRYITINNPAGWEEYEKYGLQQLEDMGYDGVILPQGDKTDYFVFSNKSIRKVAPKELEERKKKRTKGMALPIGQIFSMGGAVNEIINEEIGDILNNTGKKLYYHGRSKSRPYTGKYIFITDSLGYASGYSDENKLYVYTIPFNEGKLFSIQNKNHLNLLRKYIDDYTIKMIFNSSGQGEEIDWAALSYIGTDDFQTPEELFEHMGFLGIRLKERAGIESIYIFDEKTLTFEGTVDLNTPDMIKRVGQFYKDFTKDKNFLE